MRYCFFKVNNFKPFDISPTTLRVKNFSIISYSHHDLYLKKDFYNNHDLPRPSGYVNRFVKTTNLNPENCQQLLRFHVSLYG